MRVFCRIVRDIDFELTLIESAQVFHWQKIEDGYAAVCGGRILTDKDESPFAKKYFDDQREYSRLSEAAKAIPQNCGCVLPFPGLRVLNQPAWEALVAFILSANNNVKRIRSLVNSLCRQYGDKYKYGEGELYGFPEPETIAALSADVLSQKETCGYRADYLVKSAKMVKDGFDLEALRELSTEQARKELTKLKGVGPKVADCVLLFGCGHADAFPVDVWVKRLMKSLFGVEGSAEHIGKEALRIFGPECGLIQQSLFHAARTGSLKL